MSGSNASCPGTVRSPRPHVMRPGRPGSGWFRRWMCLDEKEASFSARGFQASSSIRQHRLELIGRTFIQAYNSAITSKNVDEINTGLDRVHPELRGFAFEGTSMACSLMDVLTIRSSRFAQVILGSGEQYKYLCWVGTGWACARLWLLYGRFRRKFFHLDPLLSSLASDGWGFHEGYFFSSRYLASNGRAPALLKGYTRRVFDQGFGRSLWFVSGANPSIIKGMVSRYPLERQADLWSGVGLACTYAGGADRCDMEALLAINQALLPHLRQGVAFGATARVHSGNVTEDTDLAARFLCSSTPGQLAALSEVAKQRTKGYQEWRSDIQRYFM
jgi:enediyne biosynthesis protein E3